MDDHGFWGGTAGVDYQGDCAHRGSCRHVCAVGHRRRRHQNAAMGRLPGRPLYLALARSRSSGNFGRRSFPAQADPVMDDCGLAHSRRRVAWGWCVRRRLRWGISSRLDLALCTQPAPAGLWRLRVCHRHCTVDGYGLVPLVAHLGRVPVQATCRASTTGTLADTAIPLVHCRNLVATDKVLCRINALDDGVATEQCDQFKQSRPDSSTCDR